MQASDQPLATVHFRGLIAPSVTASKSLPLSNDATPIFVSNRVGNYQSANSTARRCPSGAVALTDGVPVGQDPAACS